MGNAASNKPQDVRALQKEALGRLKLNLPPIAEALKRAQKEKADFYTERGTVLALVRTYATAIEEGQQAKLDSLLGADQQNAHFELQRASVQSYLRSLDATFDLKGVLRRRLGTLRELVEGMSSTSETHRRMMLEIFRCLFKSEQPALAKLTEADVTTIVRKESLDKLGWMSKARSVLSGLTFSEPKPKSPLTPLTKLRAAGVDVGLRDLKGISDWISTSAAKVATEERARLEALEAAVGLRDVPDPIKTLCNRQKPRVNPTVGTGGALLLSRGDDSAVITVTDPRNIDGLVSEVRGVIRSWDERKNATSPAARAVGAPNRRLRGQA
jgi:hypothetical protein